MDVSLKLKYIRYYFFVIFIFATTNIFAQTKDNSYFVNAASKIENLLLQHNDTSLYFKKAVLCVESAYFENQINEQVFNDIINLYSDFCKDIIKSGNIVYTDKDKDVAMGQCAVYTFITDSVPLYVNEKLFIHPPFSYNNEDFAGQEDWSNMFVSTLMQTQKGNCHSLPYLYKIIMDELGYESHLALAPNHISISRPTIKKQAGTI